MAPSKLCQLAELLLNNNISVVLTGGTSDQWVHESFRQLKVVDLVGETGIDDLIAFMINANWL